MIRTVLMIAAFALTAWPLTAASESEGESAPSVVQAFSPVYPSVARAAHVSGEVAVEAAVDSSGAVTSISIIRGHKLLNNAVERAASKWRFNPLGSGAKERKAQLSFQFTLIPGNEGTPDDLRVIFWPPYKVEVKDTPYRVD